MNVETPAIDQLIKDLEKQLSTYPSDSELVAVKNAFEEIRRLLKK